MALKRIALVVLLYAVCGLRCEAQFLGYVGQQTAAPTQLFTNQAANGTASVPNLGQAAHFLAYCNTGFAGTVSLEASPDGLFANPIPLASATYGQRSVTDSTCHVLQAGGYFQTVRARISNYVSGSVNAWYTAIASPVTFAPSGLGSTGPTAPIVCDQNVYFSLGPSAVGALVTPLAGASVYVCNMTISWGAAPTAGNISLGASTAGAGCPGYLANWFMSVTANTPQVFQVGGPLGAFVQEGPGLQLCASSGANTATATISISFAQR